MKFSKKLLSAVLMMALILSMSIMTLAAGVPSFTVTSATGKQGEIVAVDIMLSDNPGFTSATFKVNYDSSALKLVEVVDAELIPGSNHSDNMTSPYTMTWDNDKVTANYTVNGKMATLKFEVLTNVAGNYDVTLTTDGKYDILDCDAFGVSFSFIKGTVTVPCEHSYVPEQIEGNDDQHKQCCESCKDSYMEGHTFGEVTHKTLPDCDTDGEDTYTCSVCEYVKSVVVPATGEHSYGEWEKLDGESHKKTCTTCDSDPDVVTEKHIWNEGTETDAPGCDTKGEKAFECTVCHETKTEDIEATGNHSYGEWQKHNETQHKRTCTTCEGEAAVDYALHRWNEGEQTVAPDCDSEGVKTFTCLNCEETKTEPIPATGEHSYGEWVKYNETHHKKECTTCDANPDFVTEEHIWNDGEVTTPPTCTDYGVKTYTCTVCEETKTEPVDPTGDHTSNANVLLYINGTEQTGVTTLISGKPGDAVDYNALKAWAEGELAKLHNTSARVEILTFAGDHTSDPIAKLGDDKPDSVEDYCDHISTIIIDITPYYTISFKDGVDGSIFDEAFEVKLGDAFPTFDGKAYDRSGYVFNGWSDTFGLTVNKSMTLTAVWAEDLNGDAIPDSSQARYTVTYTDGVETEEIFPDQTENNILTGLGTPEFTGSLYRDGYVFNGWEPELAEKVTADVTYTAAWAEDKNGNEIDDSTEAHYDVTYTDGVDTEDIFADQVEEDILTGLATPEFTGSLDRDGYVFDGWTPEVAENVTADVTYTAVWAIDANGNGIADEDEDKFTVTYTDGVDGEAFKDQQHTGLLDGDETPAFIGTPSRGEDYIWNGWTPEVAETVSGSVTYTAVWAEDFNHNGIADDAEDKLTVIYSDGADGEVFADEVFSGLLKGAETPATTHTAPERENYMFSGWDKDIAQTVTENVTYTAVWTPDFNGNGIDDSTEAHYDVVYTDGVDGEDIFADQTYTVLPGLKTPEFVGTPVRDGYTFMGWDKVIAELVTENATYTAMWIDNSGAYWIETTPYATLDDALASVEEGGTATIRYPDDGTNSYALTLDADKIMAKNADISIKLLTDYATVLLDNKAIEEISYGADASLTVSEGVKSNGKLKNATFIDINLNGAMLTEGRAVVTVTASQDTNRPTVYLLSSDGKSVKVDAVVEGSKITFVAEQFGSYAIAEASNGRTTGYFMTGEKYHAIIIDGRIITTEHIFDENGKCTLCKYEKQDISEDTEIVED